MALGPCLTWSYGRFHTKRPGSLARKIYERRYGKLPKHVVVRHKCDNELCVSIDHLEPGTYTDNTADYHKRRCHCVRHKGPSYRVKQRKLYGLTEQESAEVRRLVARIVATRSV